jgi:hypothetical protein
MCMGNGVLTSNPHIPYGPYLLVGVPMGMPALQAGMLHACSQTRS